MAIRVGVIGCGVQGRIHLEAYRRLDGVAIVAVADTDAARAQAASRDFDVARHLTDYRSLLARDTPDLVSVCTMPDTHREISVAAVQAGAHVICEKPMALNAAEAAAMIEAASARRRLLTIGLNMRAMAAADWLRRYVARGGIGRLIHIHVWTFDPDIPWWGKHYIRAVSGGGVVASTAVHVLDLALDIAGYPAPVSVAATTARRFPGQRGATAPNAMARAAYDVEDQAAALVRLAGGAALTLQAAWAHDRTMADRGFELVGTAGTVAWPLRVMAERDGRPVDLTPHDVPETSWADSVRLHLADVVRRVGAGEPGLVTPAQALTLQRLIDGIYASAALGREVVLDA